MASKTRINKPLGSSKASKLTESERRRSFTIARLEFGERLRNRREQLPHQHSATEIAKLVGWTSQFYGEIERGTKSSDDIESWLRLADCLQLSPRKFLEDVWDTREGLTFPLPPVGDPRRKALLDLALELYGGA